MVTVAFDRPRIIHGHIHEVGHRTVQVRGPYVLETLGVYLSEVIHMAFGTKAKSYPVSILTAG